ncbi:hypothetical protein [Frankia sp. Cas4]|uniref:hypothetical protein n=1 Tax=Frankia sp. Cas4 TaxID=3073927 RepID=UPI002AD4FA61|nr:hypothetical protein [Frankia sp. Cas4]
MTLVAAAVCPHPPLLIPEVARGEPVAVREAAIRAIRRLVGWNPDVLVVVGDAPRTAAYAAGQSGSLAGFGVPRSVTLGRATHHGRQCGGQPTSSLSLSLTVGAWLLEQTSWRGDVAGFGVSAMTAVRDAVQIGVALARWAARVALLVMADGSARRTAAAPGGFDERAAAHDATVAAALAAADASALLRLEPDLSRELMAAGRASWQVLAGASLVAGSSNTHVRSCVSRAEYVDAPYGVGYVVAFWEWGSR